MNWMKSNVGKTLNEAKDEWLRLEIEGKNNKEKKNIAPQFENNTYLRDFLAGNPHKTRAEGILLWKIKKAKRGDNVYQKTDFGLVKIIF